MREGRALPQSLPVLQEPSTHPNPIRMSNMSSGAVCNASSVIEYSKLCLGDDPPEDCYPKVKSSTIVALNIMSQTVIILIGVGGNLLTLLSVPYARNRRLFGFKGGNSMKALPGPAPQLYFLAPL